MFPKAKTGRPGKDLRLMFNAVLWIACSGAPWTDLPERFGSWKTVYSRFCKWRDEETLLKKDGNAITISIRKDILWNVFLMILNSSTE